MYLVPNAKDPELFFRYSINCFYVNNFNATSELEGHLFPTLLKGCWLMSNK